MDFIDVGVGDLRWPTFNAADIGVSIGAVLLAWVLRVKIGVRATFPPSAGNRPITLSRRRALTTFTVTLT